LAIEWYFKKDGRELGPVDSDEVRRLARFGVLQPTDLIRKSDMTRWAPASAIKGLFPSPTPSTSPSPARETPPQPIDTSALVDQLVTAIQPTLSPIEAVPSPRSAPEPPPPKSSRGVWYLTAVAVLVAVAGGAYHFLIEPRLAPPEAPVTRSNPLRTTSSTPAQTEPIDPQLQAISTDSIFDRGLALQQLRLASLSERARQPAHQIICETLDNRTYSAIWPAALRALGEIGSTSDVSRLKPLIDSGPIETQCAAMATALMLDPREGLALFEPRAGDDKYGSATTSCLAEFGPRCEAAALAMLKSKEKMCRYHALNLLKEFGSTGAIQAITNAKQAEPDKSIAQGYQFTIDAINARNP
jgi:hypothetical protein